MKSITYLFIILFGYCISPVNSQSINFTINEIIHTDDSLKVYFCIKNNSEKDIVLYKPTTDDLCSSLLKIKFKSIENEDNEYHVFPCKEIIDVESIYVDSNNLIHLNPNNHYKDFISFSTIDISPFLIEGKYECQIQINYSLFEFEGRTEQLYKKDLISSIFKLKYKK